MTQRRTGPTSQLVEPRIVITVQVRFRQPRDIGAHGWLLSASLITTRARAMSERTVPSGTSKIDAISAMVRSPAKCNVTDNRGRDGNSRTNAQNTITSADGSGIERCSPRVRDQNRASVRRRRHRDRHALTSTR